MPLEYIMLCAIKSINFCLNSLKIFLCVWSKYNIFVGTIPIYVYKFTNRYCISSYLMLDFKFIGISFKAH